VIPLHNDVELTDFHCGDMFKSKNFHSLFHHHGDGENENN